MLKALRRRIEYFDEPNEYRVLRLVRDSQLISRTEIAQFCKLSKPTVSEIVNRFVRQGFLERVGESDSTDRGGRKRELLRFNPRAGFVIGVDIGMSESTVAVTDLNANILNRTSIRYSTGSLPDFVLDRLFQSVDRLVRLTSLDIEKCVGVGIGLPGLIDRSTGIIRVADTLAGWAGVNIRQIFEERFRLPVYIENDVKTRCLAEFLFGSGKNFWNQVYLWVGDGIGAGIIIDGKLHHGITESAGEIGYNEIGYAIGNRSAFPMLYYGQRDFGEVLSDSVMVDAYRRATKTHDDITVETIFRAAVAGEPLAVGLIEEVSSLASVVCVNLINTLNPELIVIGGKIAEAGSLVLERVRQKVHEDILSVPAEAVRIVPAALKHDGVIVGAVGLVLYDLFKPVPPKALPAQSLVLP
ncbi:MAG: ROK family transcriptional regulator [Ignavibacteria bacterium]|nr:ROK family transcriptional regulator [Ignavibacteria bacterium]